MADRNRHRAPAMQRQIAPKRILQRAKGVLTSAGKPILAVQDALQFAAKDSSLDVGTITRTKSLDDGSGTLGGFLRAKAKSLRSKSQDARRNRKDGPHSYSPPPLSTAVSTTSAPSDFEQPTTLVVPVASSSTQHIAEKSSMADVAVPLPLRKGVQMIKVSPGKQKSYKFQLDPDQGQIIWQSKKLRISTYACATSPLAIFDVLYHWQSPLRISRSFAFHLMPATIANSFNSLRIMKIDGLRSSTFSMATTKLFI
jgi:hypothetical protein